MITLRESATLTVTIEDGTPAEVPSVPNVPNLTFTYVGQSSQFRFVNGRSSSQLSYTFNVRAAQTNDYTIPAFRAVVEGKSLASRPLTLHVRPSGQPTPMTGAVGQAAFLKLVVPKTEVYLGETLPVEIRLHAQQGRLKQPPQLDQEGFTVGKMVQQPQTRAMVGGRPYNLLTYKSYVAAAKTGTLTLGPATMALTVPHPNSRVSFFGEPLDWMDVTLNSEPLAIQVLPLPSNNAPRDFNGAVGRYTLAARISTNSVTVGDPITLTIQIGGRGLIESINLASLDAWQNFKTYPPLTKVQTSDDFGLEGVKTFEQVIIPENAEVHEVPPITFSFFDPEKKAYQTVSQPATPITVRPASSAPAQPTIVASANPDTPRPVTDIVHIKSRLGTLAQIQPPLLLQPWFLGLQALPVLGWLAAVLWRRRQESLANNPRLRRRRRVSRRVRDGLVELGRRAAANQAEEFFATVFRLLQEQLGERLDLPASAITEAVVDERLLPTGVNADMLMALRELFQICNQARYAPLRTSQELASLIPMVESTLRQLQEVEVPQGY